MSQWRRPHGEQVIEVRCAKCGWEGRWSEVETATTPDEFGDLDFCVCPKCLRTDYDGDLFEEVV